MKRIGMTLLALFFQLSFAFAQDPGEPDEVVVGNPDGTLIYALPGSTIDIPVWVKTDENVVLFYIIAGTEDQFISARLGGNLEPIFDDWWEAYFPAVCPDSPEQGYSSQGIVGICSMSGPPYDCTHLNSDGEYVKVAEFTVHVSDDPSNIGSSTQIVAGFDPTNGSTFFFDTEDNWFEPIFTGGTIMIIEDVPTLSEWGMLVMGLLLLALGTIAVVRRRKAISKAAQ